MEWHRDDYLLTDDPAAVDIDRLHRFLQDSYWAYGRNRETVVRSVGNSLPLSLLHEGRFVGFCRAVTDDATFAWIADVIVDPEYRGKGLGTWMMETLAAHPRIADLYQLLRTKDAQTLYHRFGFKEIEAMVANRLPWMRKG